MFSTRKPARSAAQWHMELLRSWQYILLAAAMTLAIPLELRLINVGSWFVLNELGFLPAAAGAVLLLSADVSLIAVPFAWLSVISPAMACTASRASTILLQVKKYLWYAMCLLGLAIWYWGITSLKGGTGPDLSSAVFFGGIPVLLLMGLYSVVLRNISVNAGYLAQAMCNDDFPHSFGYSCGLSRQTLVLAGACAALMICAAPLIHFLQDLLPAMAAAGYSDPMNAERAAEVVRWVSSPISSTLECWPLLLLPLFRFVCSAAVYRKYMHVSSVMKGSGVYIIAENTSPNATPVHTVDK